ncbi:MAG: hypothetical protein GF370_04240 [Candidatus Nealsonbacteria bacterium]|nr:hypothetical protein [Candidatus Nealsonbacteria bacterium]
MKKKIKDTTTLAEILNCPGAGKVLERHNVPCLGCPYAEMEMEQLQIGDVCRTYGIDCKELIDDLNKEAEGLQ